MENIKNKNELTIENVKAFTDDYFDIDISNKRRKQDIVESRFFYYNFCRKNINTSSFYKIGNCVKRIHATVINGLKTFNDLYQTDKEFKKRYDVYEYNAYKFFNEDIDEVKHMTVDEKDRQILQLRKKNSWYKLRYEKMKKERDRSRHNLKKIRINAC